MSAHQYLAIEFLLIGLAAFGVAALAAWAVIRLDGDPFAWEQGDESTTDGAAVTSE